jgi:hypothetical protein
MKMKNTLFPTLESIRHEAFIYFVSLVSAVTLFAVAASLYARPIGTLAVIYIIGMGMVIFSGTWDRFAALIARKKDARKEQPLLKISEGPTPTIDLHLDDGNTIGSFPLPTEAAEVLREFVEAIDQRRQLH